jgi:hypothetical protein
MLMTTVASADLESLVDAFRAYRENPQTGGYDALRAQIKAASRRLKMTPAGLFSLVHQAYERRAGQE